MHSFLAISSIILLIILQICESTASAISDHPSTQLKSRQLSGCDFECSSLTPAFQCTAASCVCPIFNSAGSSEINTCVNCLESSLSSDASNIVLLGKVCANCQSQCASSIIAYVQNLMCDTMTCTCSVFNGAGSAAVIECANCIESLDAVKAADLREIVSQCRIPTPEHSNVGLLVGSVVGGVTGIALIIGVIYFLVRQKKRRVSEQSESVQHQDPNIRGNFNAHHRYGYHNGFIRDGSGLHNPEEQ